MKLPVRTVMDFNPQGERTIDLRPFFEAGNGKPVNTEGTERKPENRMRIMEEEPEWTEELETDDGFDICEPYMDGIEEEELPSVPKLTVSPAIRAEGKRKTDMEREREERRMRKPLKYAMLEYLLSISEAVLVFLIERYQSIKRKLDPFETKHTEKQLGYLALSLPNGVRTADQILLYYPLLSRTQRYKILRMRKDTLRMYRKIYERKR